MEEQQQYNTTWIQKGETIPSGVCPKCTHGELRSSQYWEGVYCSVCKWKFRVSKFEKKSGKEFEESYKPDLQDVIIANQEKIIKMLWVLVKDSHPEYIAPKYKEDDIPTIEEN